MYCNICKEGGHINWDCHQNPKNKTETIKPELSVEDIEMEVKKVKSMGPYPTEVIPKKGINLRRFIISDNYYGNT